MRKYIAIMTSFLVLLAGMPASFADVISSDEIMAAEQHQYSKRQLISYVDSDAVQAKLVSFGVDTDLAKQRIDNMTSAEISALNAQIQDLPAAGSIGGTIVTILLIIAILDLIGVTDVYPFINPV